MSLKEQLKNAQKNAMKAKEKLSLGTIRMVMAAIKQIEVDERRELEDSEILSVLTKMVKQRKDSQAQFEAAGRPELAEKEASEIEVLQDFLPQALSEQEVIDCIQNAIKAINATGMQDMGKVMAAVKPELTGRADMGKVSGLVKQQLSL